MTKKFTAEEVRREAAGLKAHGYVAGPAMLNAYAEELRAALAAQGQGDANLAGAPSIEDAEAMGAEGGPVVESERLAFEAWMRGHCWALSATWDGATYRSDAEQGGKLCPHAMSTRQLWAAWRDRAALTAPPASPAGGGVPDGWEFRWHTDGDDSLLLISHPLHGGVGVYKNPTSKRIIPEEMLYRLGCDLLAAAPSAPEGDGGGE